MKYPESDGRSHCNFGVHRLRSLRSKPTKYICLYFSANKLNSVEFSKAVQ